MFFDKLFKKTYEPGYVFFDVDGVLNTEEDWLRRPFTFSKRKVEILCNFCKDYNLTPVITSTWRYGFDTDDVDRSTPQMFALYTEFKKNDVELVYKTYKRPDGNRDKEISDFLNDYPAKRHILIDDEPNLYSLNRKDLYVISSKVGLQQSDIKHMAKMVE